MSKSDNKRIFRTGLPSELISILNFPWWPLFQDIIQYGRTVPLTLLSVLKTAQKVESIILSPLT
jgi:hypothetical protein